jgi:hypothetical protein
VTSPVLRRLVSPPARDDGPIAGQRLIEPFLVLAHRLAPYRVVRPGATEHPVVQPLAPTPRPQPGRSSGPVMYPSTDMVIPATTVLMSASFCGQGRPGPSAVRYDRPACRNSSAGVRAVGSVGSVGSAGAVWSVGWVDTKHGPGARGDRERLLVRHHRLGRFLTVFAHKPSQALTRRQPRGRSMGARTWPAEAVV